MAMELIGAAGLTAELKQFYDKKLLSVAEKNLVFMKYGTKRPIPPRGGKSIEFRRFEKFTVTAGSYTLTEGTPPTETQGTVSTVTATISQYGQYSKLSDLLDLQSYDPVIAEYTEKYGIAMAEALDIVVRDVVDATTTIQYAGAATVVATSGAGAVGSGNTINSAEILEMVRTLRRADARKINGRYICFIHPDNAHDLMQDTDIINAFQYAASRDQNNPLFTGVLGDWGGVTFVETTNLKVHSSYGMSGCDIYEVVMVGEEAYAVTELSTQQSELIVKARGSAGTSDPLNQMSTVGWKAALAAVILNQNFLVSLYCSSSRSTAA